ncbi:hypothetical protein RUND412_001506 [Rhizina undulata]
MDPFSLACGVAGFVGLIPPLIDVCTRGYDILSTAQNVGEDWGDLEWRRKVEEERFSDWRKKMQLQNGGLFAVLEPESRKYLLVVETLAKILQCFRKIEECRATYNYNYNYNCNRPTSSQSSRISAMSGGNSENSDSRSDGPKERRKSRFRDGVKFWSSKSKTPTLLSPTPTSASRSASSINLSGFEKEPMASEDQWFPSETMLESILQLDEKDEAEVSRAVAQFEEIASNFKKATSTLDKVRWALSGKDRLTQAVDELEKYNNGLFEITKDVIQAIMMVANPSIVFPQEFEVRIKLPFQRNRKFCGRDDILDKMCLILEPNTLTKAPAKNYNAKIGRKTVVLHGLGGTGKSQIALEYAHRFSDIYTSILWIDADNAHRTAESACKIVEQLIAHYAAKSRFSPDYREIAKTLGIPGRIDISGRMNRDAIELAMGAVHYWLSAKKNRGWLLLIDNNDKPIVGALDKLLPTCDWGSIIITARLPNLRRYGVCVEVEGIGRVAGLALLLESSGIMPRNMEEHELGEAQALVQDLGELPLALDQAGAYICSLQIPVSAYRKRLKSGLTAGFDQELSDPSLPFYKASVLTTWELSFQELSKEARELLHICAFLSNEDIPEELFRRGKSAVSWIMEDEKKLDSAIRSLFTFSLAKRKESSNAIWIHPLVHAWAREHIDIVTRRRNAEDTIALVGSAIVKDEHKRSSDDPVFERRILSHLKVCHENISEYFSGSDSLKVAEASSAISSAYQGLGYYKQAEELCQSAIAGYEKALGANDPLILDSVHALASILDDQGRYDEALQWYQKALTGREKALGNGHPSTLETMNDMSLVIVKQGRYEEALELTRKALEGKEKALGKEHRSTLETVHNMGSILDSQGIYDEALVWYRRALAGTEKELGKDHPKTLETVQSMGWIFENQGRYDDALAWFRRSLEGREKAFGSDHPVTLSTVDSMAWIFRCQGRAREALEWYQRALVGLEKALGSDHPDTLDTVHSMASMFQDQGKHSEALEWFQRVFSGREKALGKDHYLTLATVHNIGLALGNLNRHSEALEWHQKALVGREKVIGSDHRFTLETVRSIAWSLENLERYDDALEYYRRTLAGEETALGKDDPATLTTVNNMISCLGKRGRLDEAAILKRRYKSE